MGRPLAFQDIRPWNISFLLLPEKLDNRLLPHVDHRINSNHLQLPEWVCTVEHDSIDKLLFRQNYPSSIVPKHFLKPKPGQAGQCHRRHGLHFSFYLLLLLLAQMGEPIDRISQKISQIEKLYCCRIA